jgi:hypothetical protein
MIEKASMPAVELSIGPSRRIDLPSIGLMLGAGADPSNERWLDLVAQLRLGHLTVELDLRTADWRDGLARAAETSIATATPLELVAVVGVEPEGQLALLAEAITLGQAGVARTVLRAARAPAAPELVRLARRALTFVAPRASIVLSVGRSPKGTATDALTFEELDGVRISTRAVSPSAGGSAALADALAHGADVQRVASRTGLPVVVGPIAMEPADGGPAKPSFGAVWALASLASLASAGTGSVTYREVGSSSLLVGPDLVVSSPYHVVADIREWGFGQVGEAVSSDPGSVAVLCAHTIDGVRVLVANLTGEPRRCRVGPLAAERARVRVLDASMARDALSDSKRFRRRARRRTVRNGTIELQLAPFAYVRLDAEGAGAH